MILFNNNLDYAKPEATPTTKNYRPPTPKVKRSSAVVVDQLSGDEHSSPQFPPYLQHNHYLPLDPYMVSYYEISDPADYRHCAGAVQSCDQPLITCCDVISESGDYQVCAGNLEISESADYQVCAGNLKTCDQQVILTSSDNEVNTAVGLLPNVISDHKIISCGQDIKTGVQIEVIDTDERQVLIIIYIYIFSNLVNLIKSYCCSKKKIND